MIKLADEEAFQQGMASLAAGRHEEATTQFQSAVRLGSEKTTKQRRMRYLSFLGLSSALADRPTPQAIRACETAAKREFLNPELQLNLGRVLLLAGKTTRALEAFERGLRLSPKNRALRSALTGSDRRKKSPLPWLRRNHPINVALGRMLGKMRAQAAAKAAQEDLA